MSDSSSYSQSSSEQPQLQLVVHAGPLAGKGFPITSESLSFGRDPENDIHLDDDQVSRHHAQLIVRGEEVVIEDFGSTNGTLVNGQRVEGQQVLRPTDIISIGSSVFGIKGFSAANTIGVTQVSGMKPFDRPVSSSPSQPAASKASPPRSKSRPVKSDSSYTYLMIGGAMALLVIVLIAAAASAYFLSQGPESASGSIPEVVITSPVDGTEVQPEQTITVQATANDAAGVTQVELLVNDRKINEAKSPVASGQPILPVSFQWTPDAPGTYTLEIKAYNARGAVNNPTTITLNVVGPEPEETEETPTETPTPGPTEPGTPTLTTQTDLRVRAGPGLEYALLGILPTNTKAEIIGRDETRQWWQIRFAPASDGLGWVVSEPSFSTAINVENIPVALAPPTPTGTPTITPTSTNTTVPPTLTNTPIPSTNTPIPSTETPTPTVTSTPTLTPTATAEPEEIVFDVSPLSIKGGECVRVRWKASGVKEVYLDDAGVGGIGDIEDCPVETKTYNFRVVRQNDSVYTEDITVEVSNPISSSGSRDIDPNETIDLDEGNIPGDDFRWEIDGSTRRFEARSGVQLAPMEDKSSLDSLTMAECAGAAYGVHSYIDGSDSPSDSNNTLIDGRTVCYRTNEGRLGKLRFPSRSTGSLKIEWLTWR